ncbi:MAG: hypothetical protein IPO92_10020 [Saprospiraceae bacterium]|nr:hypothetical protein [Saprospiraceae bacterium]
MLLPRAQLRRWSQQITSQAKYAEATEKINREWVVATTNVTSNTMTGTYIDPTDLMLVGAEALIKGSVYTTDWFFDNSAGDAPLNTVTASTTASASKLSGQNFFGKVNIRAFLQGAYLGGSMTNTLNTSGILQAQATTSLWMWHHGISRPRFFCNVPYYSGLG